ncbi:hypothetical protein AWB82_03697 [Caballeronia glebae]|uniref:Histone H1-like nucleoprotein HC2 n=1 Tax=Caballeronia glebae TaxID=1777143 RepID=A0A158B865_9BURK|nr:hypothetical protein [Caballeronia glebae]SAK66233.1 hypothetical protein AWB82_03697 [Caballeronia glebae]
MSTPQAKAPTTKAFNFPKSPAENAPASTKPDGKLSKKTPTKTTATPEPETKAATTTPKTAKKPAAKAPAAKKAEKTPSVEAAAATKPVETQPKASARTKRVKKEKVVRDSFTMPKSDYAKIAKLKDKCQKSGLRVKKSELLRAALAMLDAAPEKRLVEAIKALETVKTGRPPNA